MDINFSIDNKSNNSIKDIDITDQDNNVFTSDRDSISFPVEHRHPTVFECSIDLCYESFSSFNQSQYSRLQSCPVIGLEICAIFCRIQLNKYETAPNFIQLNQNLTSDCLLI